MSVGDMLLLVWGISAAVAMEAYEQALQPKEKGRWIPIVIGSLMPAFNTYIAYRFVRDKLTRN